MLLTALVGCADSDKNNIFDCTSTDREEKLTATVSFKKNKKGEILYFNSLPFTINWEGSYINASRWSSDGKLKMDLYFHLDDSYLNLIDEITDDWNSKQLTSYYCKLRF